MSYTLCIDVEANAGLTCGLSKNNPDTDGSCNTVGICNGTRRNVGNDMRRRKLGEEYLQQRPFFQLAGTTKRIVVQAQSTSPVGNC